MVYGPKSSLVTLLSGVGLWLRAPTGESDLSFAAGEMSEVNRRLNALEDRVRSAHLASKLGAGLSILVWLGASLFWLLLMIPWALVVRSRRDRSSSKHVLLVSHESTVGGAPQSLLAIIQGMDRRAFNPVVLTGTEGPFAEQSRMFGVPTFVLPISQLLKQGQLQTLPREVYRFVISLPFVLYLLAYLPIRLVHINTLVTPDAAFASRLLRIPIVWHFRETLLIRWWEHVQILVLRVLAHRIVCNSRFSYGVVARHGVPEEKLRMVYNCVTEQYFRSRLEGQAFRRSLGVGSGDVLVGCVGRAALDKGQDILVKAASRVAKAHPGVVFVLVGAADESAFVGELREFIEAQGLRDRFHLTAPRVDIPEIMSGLDIHVTPSRWEETFGRVALEAMAGGALSIVSDRGGLPEVVQHGRSGLVFEGENVDALAQLLDQAIDDRDMRERLGRAGRQRAREVFGCKQHLQQIEGIYRELLDA